MQKLLEMLQKIKSKASATATGVNFNDISIIAIYIEQLRIESEGYLLDTSLTEDVKVEKKMIGKKIFGKQCFLVCRLIRLDLETDLYQHEHSWFENISETTIQLLAY